jgi:hypothetical protein
VDKYELAGADWVELYQFYQSRADDIKAALFASVTWIIGFAAAVLGFVIVTFLDLTKEPLKIKFPWLAMLFCVVGCALCVYALLLLYDGANHIRANWKRADECEEHVKDLPRLAMGTVKRRTGKVWQHMSVVVGGFLIIFVALLLVFANAA